MKWKVDHWVQEDKLSCRFQSHLADHSSPSFAGHDVTLCMAGYSKGNKKKNKGWDFLLRENRFSMLRDSHTSADFWWSSLHSMYAKLSSFSWGDRRLSSFELTNEMTGFEVWQKIVEWVRNWLKSCSCYSQLKRGNFHIYRPTCLFDLAPPCPHSRLKQREKQQ